MYYTILKQWKTLDGTYYSSTVNKPDYDTAIGEYHSMFKPLQNDANVACFFLTLVTENGGFEESCAWSRRIEEPEQVEEVTE